ncbi:unnamed protein product [Didymodactylos carnosus]|uniref:Uncharacterized protein n=1 Tax=Didymodactylos carnosus TaxID=1234261 RepID=A0A815HC82_9BILA|nr:unnamed protein product [Didymodactylos carnosus]CAF1374197.1 unnamed protein product [Didymodactylos carnosus]CAF4183101.1 unnamed protein product [Didymodactylos carnosus]CAF4220042.1 unnamed protein product [Didymodactylos carnosus]
MGNCIGKKSYKSQDHHKDLRKLSPCFIRTSKLYKTNPNSLLSRKKQLIENYNEHTVQKKPNRMEQNQTYIVLPCPSPSSLPPTSPMTYILPDEVDYYTENYFNYSNVKETDILSDDDLVEEASPIIQSPSLSPSSSSSLLSSSFNRDQTIENRNIAKIRHSPSPPLPCSKRFKKIDITTTFNDNYYVFNPTINLTSVTFITQDDKYLTSSVFNNNYHYHPSNDIVQNNDDILCSSSHLIESTATTLLNNINSLNDSYTSESSSKINMGQLISKFNNNNGNVENEIECLIRHDDKIINATIFNEKEEKNQIFKDIELKEEDEILVENDQKDMQDENKCDDTIPMLHDNHITMNDVTTTTTESIGNDNTDNLTSDESNNQFIHQNTQEIDLDNNVCKISEEQEKPVILTIEEQTRYYTTEIDNENLKKLSLNEMDNEQTSIDTCFTEQSSEQPSSPSTSNSSLSSQLSFSSTELVVSSRSSSSPCSISPKNRRNYTKNHYSTNLLSLINCQQTYLSNNNQFLSSHIYLPCIVSSHQQSQQRGEQINIMHDIHQYIDVDECYTLSSIVDDIIQQQIQQNSRQFIRIHRRKKTVLVGHKKLEATPIRYV